MRLLENVGESVFLSSICETSDLITSDARAMQSREGQGSRTQGKIEVESNVAIEVSHKPWLSCQN